MPKFFREFISRQRVRLIAYGILSFIIACMIAGRSYLYAGFFDTVIGFLDANNVDGFTRALGGIVLLELVLYVSRLFTVALHSKFRGYMNICVRVFGLDRIIDQDYTHLAKVGSGKLLQIVHSGMEGYSFLIYEGLRKGIELGVSLVTIVVLLGSSHYFFLFYIVGAIVFLRFFQTKAFQRLTDARHRDKALNESYTQQTTKILMNFLMMKVFGLKDQELTTLEHLGQERVDNYIWIKFWFNAIASLANLLLMILLFMSLRRYGKGYIAGDVSLQTLLFVFLLISFSRNQFYSFGLFVAELAEKLTYIHRYDEVIGHIGEDQEGKKVVTGGDIHIADVSYAYEGGDELYTDLSLHMPVGQKIALVGTSGSGKSTMFKLLTRLIVPASGSVSIGELSVDDANIGSLYRHIGYFYQDPLVFDGTVRENLTLGGAYTDEVLMQALAYVSLDLDLDQVIGERGVLLSGGEKQRLALARVFVYDFEVLLLDEPTSNLDPELERTILDTIFRLYADKTICIISHREYALGLVERVVEMKKGEIVSDEMV